MNNKIENTLFQCRAINKEFGNVKANDDISINIGNSQIHALLGENGAGKSTLVKIIYGLLQPDRGSMTFLNKEFLPKSPKDARAQGIGMVFQHFSLFEPLTAFENILLGLDKEIGEKDLHESVITLSESFQITLLHFHAVSYTHLTLPTKRIV